MMKSLPIPREEQLEALASGLGQVYRLLRDYLGDLNQVPDYRRYITITKDELAVYLSHHIALAEQHLKQPTDPMFHESPVLERIDDGYRVYEIDHGQPRFTREFSSLAEAAAEYLMLGW